VLKLGNLDSKRDWGYAKDYVEAMWMILQNDKADDFVIASGKTHTVREFVNTAAKIAGFDIEWDGNGIDEKGVDRKSGKVIVSVDSKFFRPVENVVLCGCPEKAEKILGWKPKTSFEQLVELMMKADIEAVTR
jgi:GDPmannose 4,6-dehydratase